MWNPPTTKINVSVLGRPSTITFIIGLLSFRLTFAMAFLPTLTLPKDIGILFYYVAVLLIGGTNGIALTYAGPIVLGTGGVDLCLFVSALDFGHLLGDEWERAVGDERAGRGVGRLQREILFR